MKLGGAIDNVKRAIRRSQFGERITSAVLRDYLRGRLDTDRASEQRAREGVKATADFTLVIVELGSPELTLNCMTSLADAQIAPAEAIIIGPHFSPEVDRLIGHLPGVRIIQVPGVNSARALLVSAARAATNEHLLCVHAGLEDRSDWTRAAATIISNTATDIGLICGMVIAPTGKIIQAGGVFNNHSGELVNYGEDERPTSGPYRFAREVDFCTDIFFVTRRDLLLDVASKCVASNIPFSLEYSARLIQTSHRILYDPALRAMQIQPLYRFRDRQARVKHASSRIATESFIASTFQTRRRLVREKGWPRAMGDTATRVLMIDDRVPHTRLGRGYPRSNLILRQLVADGCAVSFYPLLVPEESWHDAYSDIPHEVEILMGFGRPAHLATPVLERRWNDFDRVIVSRPDNMEWLRKVVSDECLKTFSSKVVYDAEALFAKRNASLRRLRGKSATEELKQIDREVALATDCLAVTCVNRAEALEFRRRGIPNVHVLSHGVEVLGSPPPFGSRRGLLFVGSLSELDIPNADGLIWFIEKVWPLVREACGDAAQLTVVGNCCPEVRRRVATSGVTFAGIVDDLSGLYGQARVFVAPIRYGAGIPLKLTEAAAHGLPILTTSLLASQLEWNDGREVLVADEEKAFGDKCLMLLNDEKLWCTLQQHALTRVESEYSVASFSVTLRRVCAAHPLVEGDPTVLAGSSTGNLVQSDIALDSQTLCTQQSRPM